MRISIKKLIGKIFCVFYFQLIKESKEYSLTLFHFGLNIRIK